VRPKACLATHLVPLGVIKAKCCRWFTVKLGGASARHDPEKPGDNQTESRLPQIFEKYAEVIHRVALQPQEAS
jgi:hypothetical protein